MVKVDFENLSLPSVSRINKKTCWFNSFMTEVSITQLKFACLKLRIETLEKVVKYVQS